MSNTTNYLPVPIRLVTSLDQLRCHMFGHEFPMYPENMGPCKRCGKHLGIVIDWWGIETTKGHRKCWPPKQVEGVFDWWGNWKTEEKDSLL